jgi:hypothetical protein
LRYAWSSIMYPNVYNIPPLQTNNSTNKTDWSES